MQVWSNNSQMSNLETLSSTALQKRYGTPPLLQNDNGISLSQAQMNRGFSVQQRSLGNFVYFKHDLSLEGSKSLARVPCSRVQFWLLLQLFWSNTKLKQAIQLSIIHKADWRRLGLSCQKYPAVFGYLTNLHPKVHCGAKMKIGCEEFLQVLIIQCWANKTLRGITK